MCNMNRKIYLAHNNHYKRRPSNTNTNYVGVIDPLLPETPRDEFDDFEIEGSKKDLCLTANRLKQRTSMSNRVESNSGISQSSFASTRLLSRGSNKQSLVGTPKPGYDKLRDSKVYKRTRHVYQQNQTPAEKWPASLELSGKKIAEGETQSSPEARESDSPQKENEPEQQVSLTPRIKSLENQLPPLTKSTLRNSSFSPRGQKVNFSSAFYADFGLRSTDKTDSFAGYRKGRDGSENDFAKEIQAKADRHIYACQVLSNSRRGSKALQSVNALKETLGPRTNTTLCLPTKYVRTFTQSPPERQNTLVDISKRPPFSLFIRTRDSPELSAVRHRTEPLPEISGRTLVLGFSSK